MTLSGKFGFSKTQRYLFLVALFAIVLGLIFFGIFQYNLTQQGKGGVQSEDKKNEALGETATSTLSFLNGLPVPITSATSCAAVMIDNNPEVEQNFGLNSAALVYEAPVEGGITRFMAVYQLTTSTVSTIGPVRSARPYFLDWLQELNCLYAHVGGSNEALDKIKSTNIFDLNQFYNGGYFWRDTKYVAPHNTFTDIENLTAAWEKKNKNFPGQEVKSWLFSKQDETSSKKLNQSAVYIDRVGGWQVGWIFNPKNKMWERWLNKSAVFDEKNKIIQAKNVVIQYVKTEVLDEVGRLAVKTIGSGRADILKDDKIINGRWEKKSATARTKFFGPDTKEIEFNPGVIWIEVEPEILK
ncbi:MAG: DUF3048 domain-containing protein [Candidatus Magasanikbacteria bacterium]|nr:DUF3048 domain-containing protein [Candidatus Magasanikbacteria bacterium]